MYSLGDFFEVAGQQFGELVDVLGPDNIFLSLIIIGFFFLLTKVLVKWKLFQDDMGEPNMSSTGVVALIISFTIAWFVNKSGAIESVHAGDAFDYLGYSTGPAATIIPLLILGVFIYMIFKIGPLFLILGGLALIGISFTDYIYSKGMGIFTGIVLLLIGGLWAFRRWKKEHGGELGSGEAGGNIPGASRDWLKKLVPIIGLIALIAFVILFLSGSGTSNVGLIIIIAIAAIVVIIILIKIIKKRKKNLSGLRMENEKRFFRKGLDIGKSGIKATGKGIAGAGKGVWSGGKKVAGAGWGKTKKGWDLGKQKFNEKRRNWDERQAYKEKARRESEETRQSDDWRKNWKKSQQKEDKKRQKEEKRRKENYERAKAKEREQKEKKEKLLEYKKQEEKVKKERDEKDKIRKKIRKLVREVNHIESKNGRNSTSKSRKLRNEILRLRRRLNSL